MDKGSNEKKKSDLYNRHNEVIMVKLQGFPPDSEFYGQLLIYRLTAVEDFKTSQRFTPL